MRRRLGLVVGIAFIYVRFVGIAMAEEARACDNCDTHSTVSVTVENDKFFTGRDRHYTNGLQAAWMSGEDVPSWVTWLGDHVPTFAGGSRRRYGLSLGHMIFTPRDLQTSTLITTDRPYAAWLYAGFSLTADTGSHLDTLDLAIGVVGPWAQGEEVQNQWHKLIGVSEAEGWRNQIRNEPGGLISYERTWRGFRSSDASGLGFDVNPHVGGALGNVMIYGAGGVSMRLGWNLPNDYGVQRMRPGVPGSTFFVPSERVGFYVFAGTEGRVVGRNIFIDGNSFRQSPSVGREILVGDVQGGVALVFDNIRIAYTQVLRTREFEGQNKPDIFSSINVSLRW